MRSGLAIALLLLYSSSAVMAEPTFPTVPEGFRIGMEMEFTSQTFERLTQYFDFDALKEKRWFELPRNFLDDYLENSPQALDDLPAELRAQLIEGLDLGSLVQANGQDPASPQGILGADGKPMDPSKARIVLPGAAEARSDGGLILLGRSNQPGQIKPMAPTESGMLERTVAKELVAWQILNARWRTLDLKTREAAARWDNLSPEKKAIIAIDEAGGRIALKKDLSPEDQALFSKLHWLKDGQGTIEFTHREDLVVSDPKEFYQDVIGLARRAGPRAERAILNPESVMDVEVSFQYHVSVRGKNLRGRGLAINQLTLLRRVNAGVFNDLKREGKYLYESDGSSKGLVRLHDDDRVEFRTHPIGLDEELKLNLKALSTEDEAEGLALLNDEIKRQLRPDTLGKILELNPGFVFDFSSHLTEPHAAEALKLVQFVNHPETWPDGPPDIFWKTANGLLRNTNIADRIKVREILRTAKSWPPEFWAEVPALLKGRSSVNTIARALQLRTDWPPDVIAAVEQVDQSGELGLKGHIAQQSGRTGEVTSASTVVTHGATRSSLSQDCSGDAMTEALRVYLSRPH